MIVKCSCQHCGVHIEFDAEAANQFAPCPSCGSQTRLLIPGGKLPNPYRYNIAPTPEQRKKWSLKLWIAIGLISLLLTVIIYILCLPELRHDALTWIGIAGVYVFAAVILCLCLALGYLLFVSGILLHVIIAVLVVYGLFLCGDGFLLKQNVEASKDGTIFQQIYATVEMVGGALVFCGAMMLSVLLQFQREKSAAEKT